ncbi:MAG: hypothetical protein R3C42_01720 [Parvularculaceae bacterium]
MTPRSGGIAIFAGFAAATALFIAFLTVFSHQDAGAYLIFFLFAFFAFLFGALDDARALGARLKLLTQILIACGFVALAGAVEQIPAPFVGELDLGGAAFALTVLWIVAFMNVFNFMDGINGIAASCALFVLAALAVSAAGSAAVFAPQALFLACALFGFLPLNLSQGRIFMGDSGSQFAGFSIAALAVLTVRNGDSGVSAMFVPIAFLPFIFDVAFTLIHRAARRRNIFAAHNEHLYQLLVRLGGSHEAVTTLYLTLVVVTTTIALVANSFGAGVQYALAAGLVCAFLPAALAIKARARKAGLYSGGAEIARKEPSVEDGAFRTAAE